MNLYKAHELITKHKDEIEPYVSMLRDIHALNVSRYLLIADNVIETRYSLDVEERIAMLKLMIRAIGVRYQLMALVWFERYPSRSLESTDFGV